MLEVVHVAFRDGLQTSRCQTTGERGRGGTDWAQERTVTVKGSQKRMQCGVGMPANAICFCPLSRVTKHVGSNSESVFLPADAHGRKNVATCCNRGVIKSSARFLILTNRISRQTACFLASIRVRQKSFRKLSVVYDFNQTMV